MNTAKEFIDKVLTKAEKEFLGESSLQDLEESYHAYAFHCIQKVIKPVNDITDEDHILEHIIK